MSKRSHEHSAQPEAVPVPSVQQPENGASPSEIAEAAYLRWVERGCPQGSAEEDWLEAEKELKCSRPKQEAGLAPAR